MPRRRSELDRRDEVQAHVRIEADRLEAEGLPADEAVRVARARFGYSEHLDPAASTRRGYRFGVLGRDARHAVRRLLRSPASTITILASLALGIGASTAILSLTDQALVRSLPVEAPEELVQLHWEGSFVGGGRGFGSLLPHPLYVDLQGDQQVFRGMVARSPGEVTLVTEAGPERARVELVTGAYFSTLGVRSHVGRLFDAQDDLVPDGHPVVVLSHAYWTARFGADSTVVGRSLRINARPMTIVGVAPRSFHGTDWSVAPAVWLPMMMNDLVHAWGDLDERRVRFQHVFARLRPGVSRQQAEEGLQPWFQRYLRADMEREGWPGGLSRAEVDRYLDSRLALVPGGRGQAARDSDLRSPMLILSAATVLLLFLACLNVANLSLAKAAAGQRDTAVRSALGASRRRVVVERVVESGLLATIGGAVGVALAPLMAGWILGYLAAGGGDADMALSAGLDGRALLAALIVAVAATILSGVGPAWFVATTRPMGALRVSARGSTGSLAIRKALVVGQVGLALVLLTGAGLFAETLRGLRSGGPGFETDGLLTFTVEPASSGHDAAESRRILGSILTEVGNIPGVLAAGVAVWPLLAGSGWSNTVLVEALQRFETEDWTAMNAVSPGYFEALGIPLAAGRSFGADDRWDEGGSRMRSAIVSESFVERYLPGQNPLGVRIDFGGAPERAARMEIVGVVRGYREQRLRDPRPQVFFSIWERETGTGTFYVRTRGGAAGMPAAVRDAVGRAAPPSVSVEDVRTMDEQIDRLLVFDRTLDALASVFALFGTLLAAIGVYGVLSFSAASRRREVGVRLALGAPRQSAGGLIIREALALAALGIGIALPVSWTLGRLVESQLFGVGAIDATTSAAAVVLLLIVCVASSAIPAWRMRSVDPVDVLRVD